jgi:ribosomal protein S27E
LVSKQTKRLRRDRLTHDILAREKAQYETEAIARTCTKVQPGEEESLDCPDCFDTMMKLYDWDKIKNVCENCGLTIANPATPSTYDSSWVEN